MSIVYVTNWYKKIPELERDLPVLLYNNKAYTPREIYNEVINDTPLGNKLQEKLEELGSGTSFSYGDLRGLDYIAKLRVEKVLNNLPKGFSLVSVINGKRIVWNKDSLKNSELFKQAVEFEKKQVVKILQGV